MATETGVLRHVEGTQDISNHAMQLLAHAKTVMRIIHHSVLTISLLSQVVIILVIAPLPCCIKFKMFSTRS